jgi:hypothetical protein
LREFLSDGLNYRITIDVPLSGHILLLCLNLWLRIIALLTVLVFVVDQGLEVANLYHLALVLAILDQRVDLHGLVRVRRE